jgi:pilus assembly protein Flp/PilA
MNAIRRFLRSDDGPTAVEYAVMLSLIVVTCMSAIGLLVEKTQASYNYSAGEIQNAISSTSGSSS